jgi:superfamily II DNA or RNA helicase
MLQNEPAKPEAQGAPWELRKWQAEALPIVIDALKARRSPLVAAFMGSGKSILLAELIRQTREIPGQTVVVATPKANLVRQLAGTMRKALGPASVGEFYASAKQADRRVVVTTYQSLSALVQALGQCGRIPCLLVCDEAHRTAADAASESIVALEQLKQGRHLARMALTATPFRSEDKERLALWEDVVYRYGYRDGIRDGVIVPWRVFGWDGTGFEAKDTDNISIKMLDTAAVDADIWPCLANARSIADAEQFAAKLCEAGYPAAATHSRLSRKEQDERVEMLRTGALKVLVHVSMLVEGSDFPWLKCLLMRRHTQAKVRFVQEVGRVLRSHPGKTEGIIIDIFDLMGKMGMDHPDALGEALESNLDEDAIEEEEEEERERDNGPVNHPAVPSMSLGQWLEEVLQSLHIGGHFEYQPPRAEWEVTDRQIAAVENMAYALRWFPASQKEAKARLNLWIKSKRVHEFPGADICRLIMLLRYLIEASKPSQEYGKKYGWKYPQARWEFPAVTLPQIAPSLRDVAK